MRNILCVVASTTAFDAFGQLDGVLAALVGAEKFLSISFVFLSHASQPLKHVAAHSVFITSQPLLLPQA